MNIDLEFINHAVNEQIKIEEDTYGTLINSHHYISSLDEEIDLSEYSLMRITSKIAKEVLNNLINVDDVIIQEYWINFAIKFPMKSAFSRIPEKYRGSEIELLYKLN